MVVIENRDEFGICDMVPDFNSSIGNNSRKLVDRYSRLKSQQPGRKYLIETNEDQRAVKDDSTGNTMGKEIPWGHTIFAPICAAEADFIGRS